MPALLEIYGTSKFLADADASLIHEDEYGKLYRVSTGDEEEPLVMVQVVDATQNKGADRKEYFLRVSPAVHTAKEAVAWTFGLEEEDYAPTKQT